LKKLAEAQESALASHLSGIDREGGATRWKA
jgi:hypothetical protein